MSRVLTSLALVIVSFTFAAAACGSGSSSSDTADASAPAGNPLGSATVEGADGFVVLTATWTQPAPVGGKPVLTILLATNDICAKSTCGKTVSASKQLQVRLYGMPGGAIGPGAYSILSKPDAGQTFAGQLEVRLGHSTSRVNGCEVGDQPAAEGLVMLESASATEVKGTFEVDVTTAAGTNTHLTGAFDALHCP
jgi:hypothetical protein